MFGRCILIAASVLLGLSGCADPKFSDEGRVTVSEVADNINRWDGQIHRIRGWLGNCEGLDCALYPTLDDARTVEIGDPGSDAWMGAMDRALGIASIGDFDERAAPYQFSEVEVIALVSAECRSPNRACTDRVPDLFPFEIKPINPANEAE